MSGSKLMGRVTRSNSTLAVALAATIAAAGLFPVWYLMYGAARVPAETHLPSSAQVRGAYINSGSKDVGPDRPV